MIAPVRKCRRPFSNHFVLVLVGKVLLTPRCKTQLAGTTGFTGDFYQTIETRTRESNAERTGRIGRIGRIGRARGIERIGRIRTIGTIEGSPKTTIIKWPGKNAMDTHDKGQNRGTRCNTDRKVDVPKKGKAMLQRYQYGTSRAATVAAGLLQNAFSKLTKADGPKEFLVAKAKREVKKIARKPESLNQKAVEGKKYDKGRNNDKS